ncbi:hypothetical protein HYW76_04805 [Candidatus Pacearchaeota archaeon]|nr:hypothetical protein [Candidatus Pacearchaeota archaeon]
MADPHELQNNLNKIQNSDDIASLFGRIVSGKLGYKAVIDKNKPQVKCPSCNFALSGDEKFCPECGNRLEK